MRNSKETNQINELQPNNTNSTYGTIDSFDIMSSVNPLINWFENHARILPWRENPQPYYVWISEIMLQQTRVEAVKPYFDRFITALPTVESLANCPEDTYLKLWEGLGYYNRVRNLNAAAKQIMENYEGEIPSEYSELLNLKGIGHYTAGAISSIAYGKCNPAVDGNVLRVISRLTGDASDIMKQSVRSHMEEVLKDVMEKSKVDPSKYNQALMELGATVCLPNGAPHCEACPWNHICVARKNDLISELPVKTKAKDRRIEERTVLMLRDGNQVAIRKRPDKGLLAGLYELPNELGHMDQDSVIEYVKSLGLQPIRVTKLNDGKHIFSHVEWHMIGYQITVEEVDLKTNELSEKAKAFLWVDAYDAREKYAIPNAFKAYEHYYRLPVE